MSPREQMINEIASYYEHLTQRGILFRAFTWDELQVMEWSQLLNHLKTLSDTAMNP